MRHDEEQREERARPRPPAETPDLPVDRVGPVEHETMRQALSAADLQTVELVGRPAGDNRPRPWVRWGLLGAGMLPPVVALALPPVRRLVASRAGLERQRQRRAREQQLALLARLQGELAQRQRRRGLRRTLRPLVWSALVSGGVTLLYAPRAGAEMRAQVRQAAGPIQERAAQLTAQVKDRTIVLQGQAQQALGQVKEQASTLQGQAQEKLGQVKARAQSGTAAGQGDTAGSAPHATLPGGSAPHDVPRGGRARQATVDLAGTPSAGSCMPPS